MKIDIGATEIGTLVTYEPTIGVARGYDTLTNEDRLAGESGGRLRHFSPTAPALHNLGD
jgi:hypothetical protein